MGKQRKKSTEIEESKIVEAPVENIESERYESDLVKLKKENKKIMDKSIKNMETKVKQNVDQKQVISAIKALQKHFQHN